MKRQPVSRRRFLKAAMRAGTAAVMAPLFVPASSLGYGRPAPSDRIHVGFIGVGWKGLEGCWGSLVQSFTANPLCRSLAVCDINSQKCEKAKQTIDESYGNKDCRTYRDFRELLACDDMDAVVIATPDHWHAIQTIAACRAGKDVYCEKPLSLTIREARAMVNAARQYGRVVQTGNQSRSFSNIAFACRALREGIIGQIREIHAACGGPSMPCNLPGEPVPSHIDWDLWLGPAPWRPYHSALVDKGFRPFQEYSGGGMTDWGCHHFDLAQWALGMDASGPVEIHPPDGKEFKWITFRYANGTKLFHQSDVCERQGGVTFIGTEGDAWGHGMSSRWRLRGDNVWRLPPGPGGAIEGAKAHSDDFLEAVRDRRKPNADVEIGCRTVSVCHLANITAWLGRPIRWNPEREEILGDEEAGRWLDRAKREPWNL
jgi:predicted dehydrogenase